MSTKSDIIAALVEPAIAAARWLWHKANGEDTQPDEDALKRIALASVQAQLQRGELELQRIAALAGIAIAEAELARALLELRAELALLDLRPGASFGTLLDGAEQMPEMWTAPQHEFAGDGVCIHCGKVLADAYLACVERP